MRILLFSLMVGLASSAVEAQDANTFLESPMTRLTGATASAAISVERVSSKTEVRNAEQGQYPADFLVVRSLTIQVNGESIFVPRSAFADLIWVTRGSIYPSKNGGTLVIAGGDASESYVARIAFDRTRVLSRKVSSTLTPNRVSEETHYFANTIK